ncbi:hypothetical protein BKI52_11930 [marine bacterium AO1-C]|nr:hypothetical protein BKI52_11930 [marine bacterium AO1-C]
MKTKTLFTLLLSACCTLAVQAQFNQDDLIGIWQINTVKALKSMPEARKEKMDANGEMLAMMFLTATMEFRKDGTSISKGPSFSKKEKVTKGKWKLEGDQLSVTNEGGKTRTMRLVSLASDHFIVDNPKQGRQQVEFISLNPILEEMTQTNKVKATKKQLIGDWTLSAVENQGRTFVFGVTYTLAKDGTQKLTTVLGQTDSKKNGSWKMMGNNSFEVKTSKETNTFKIVYFTPDRMIAIDKKGDKAMFDRKK